MKKPITDLAAMLAAITPNLDLPFTIADLDQYTIDHTQSRPSIDGKWIFTMLENTRIDHLHFQRLRMFELVVTMMSRNHATYTPRVNAAYQLCYVDVHHRSIGDDGTSDDNALSCFHDYATLADDIRFVMSRNVARRSPVLAMMYGNDDHLPSCNYADPNWWIMFLVCCLEKTSFSF